MAFIQTPSRIISCTSKRPEANAIAFGGVETGNTNASEHVRVTGIINLSGCSSIDAAILDTRARVG